MAKKKLPSIPRLIILLTLLILVIGALGYVFWLNPDPVSISWSKGQAWEGPAALAIIVIFCLGSFSMFLFMLFFVFSQRLAYRKLRKSTELVRSHEKLIIDARTYFVAGDITKARSIYKKIISQNPNDVVTRILLAKTYRDTGDNKEALKILDEARLTQKKNLELLFLAAHLNELVGNATAAKDNLSIALKASPQSMPALKGLVRLNRQLELFDDALAYQDQRIKLAPSSEQRELQEERAEIELEKVKKSSGKDYELLTQELKGILKRHKDYPKALIALAKIESDNQLRDAASKRCITSYKQEGNISALRLIADMWLSCDNPDRAIASVRNALISRPPTDSSNSNGQLFLASLLLSLGKLDEAQTELNKARETLADSSSTMTIAEALIASEIAKKKGDTQKAFNLLNNALKQCFKTETNGLYLPSSDEE